MPTTTIPVCDPPRHNTAIHPVHRTLATAANLANLLPTGTVLGFRALTPSFSNQGSCNISNKYLTAILIGICAVACFLSSFTDSFVDSDGKLYYGIASFKGLYIFNYKYKYDNEAENDMQTQDLTQYKLCCIDFVHAFLSIIVFLVFALSDSDVQSCYFPVAGENLNALVINLPLGAGVLSSFLFMLFPTTRRGIGVADLPLFSK
ncbi:putative disease resistance protein NBS-LRR family protein [Heracleum sosnowskyi]|uniref:Disease resistance protein NBS-LRR family protein n=1 Tax=Heracleum sosnowskyi TaxID=360622 RepID=A0AAD8M382_9APIA|nr:putative disease resistance protein NBS-LRR family protein [Heracleum sosnowskyi]